MKRGVSELISTVLIILVVVALLIAVFLFFDIKKYLINTNKDPCDDIEINVLNACYNEKSIIIKLENNGKLDINDGFLFRIYGNQEYNIPSPPLTMLNSFDVREINLPYENFVGNLVKIQVLPKIIIDNKMYVCDSKLKEYKVNAC